MSPGVALVMPFKFTVNVSFASISKSPTMGTLIVVEIPPAGMLHVSTAGGPKSSTKNADPAEVLNVPLTAAVACGAVREIVKIMFEVPLFPSVSDASPMSTAGTASSF